jgi:hypothetical protein
MNQAAAKASRREIRRAIGAPAAQLVLDHEQAVRVFAEILTRPFWGRLCWLILGR